MEQLEKSKEVHNMYKDLHIFEEAYKKSLPKKKKILREAKIVPVDKLPIGISRKGSLPETLSVADITKVLGFEPNGKEMDKTSVSWVFKLDGKVESIWDYKGARWSTSSPAVEELFKNVKGSGSDKPVGTPGITPTKLRELLEKDIPNVIEFLDNHNEGEDPLDILESYTRVLNDIKSVIKRLKRLEQAGMDHVSKEVLEDIENVWVHPILDSLPGISDNQDKLPKRQRSIADPEGLGRSHYSNS